MDRQQFQAQIQSGKLGGAWLFTGPEENLKSEALAALRAALLPPGFEALNESVLENPSADELIAACETLPLMADRRLVVVRGLAGFSGKAEGDAAIPDYIPRVPDSCVLAVLGPEAPDARKKLYKAFGAARVVQFSPMTGAALRAWVRAAFEAEGKHCDNQVADELTFTCGEDTALLRGEIAKLSALAGDRPSVTGEDVRRAATRSREYSIFSMLDAAVGGRQKDAFRLLRDMQRQGEEDMRILSMLLRQYRRLQMYLIMRYERLSDAQIAQKLGLQDYGFQRFIQQAARVGNKETKCNVRDLLDLEYRCKSGRISQRGIAETALLTVFENHRLYGKK